MNRLASLYLLNGITKTISYIDRSNDIGFYYHNNDRHSFSYNFGIFFLVVFARDSVCLSFYMHAAADNACTNDVYNILADGGGNAEVYDDNYGDSS